MAPSRPNSRPSSQRLPAPAELAGQQVSVSHKSSTGSDGALSGGGVSSSNGERPRSGQFNRAPAAAEAVTGGPLTVHRSRQSMVVAYSQIVKEDLRILDVLRETASSQQLLLPRLASQGAPSLGESLPSILHHAKRNGDTVELVVDAAQGRVSHASRAMLVLYLVAPCAQGAPARQQVSSVKGRPLESKDLVRNVVPAQRVDEWNALLTAMAARELLPLVRNSYTQEVDLKGLKVTESTDGHHVLVRSSSGEDAEAARSVLSRAGLLHVPSQVRLVNAMLLLLHWMRDFDGLPVVSEAPDLFALVAAVCDDGLKGPEPCAALAKICDRELRRPFSLSDFRGVNPEVDVDNDRLRKMITCAAAVKMPHWFLESTKPLHTRPPSLVASQLTLLVYDLIFRHITPDMMRAHNREQAAPIQDMVRVFKVLSFFPLTMILAESLTVDVRLELLNFWLDVARHLRELGNFHAFFGVAAGLTQPLLKFLWDMLPPKHNSHKLLDEIKRAFSPLNDYRVYRADLSKQQGRSCIPFLGVANKRLAFLEATELSDEVVDLGSVLAHKIAIDEFLEPQQHPYSAMAAGGTTFFMFAGPPGPSPYRLAADGRVLPALSCRFPPANISTVFNAAGSPTSRALSGVIELDNDSDLRVLLAFRMSETLTEEGVRQLAEQAKIDSESKVLDGLAKTGFLY